MKNKQGVKIKIEDEAYYEVTLARAISFKGRILSPIAKNTMKGAMLKTLSEDAIADVEPIV